MTQGTSTGGRGRAPDVAGEVLASLREREPLIRWGIAVGVLFFGVVGVLFLVSPSGPTSATPRAVLVVVTASTIPAAAIMSRLRLVDMWWLRGRRTALLNGLFATYAIGGITAALATIPDPALRLYGAALFAIVSVYIAQFAPRPLLAAYVAVTSAIVITFAVGLHRSIALPWLDVAARAMVVLAVVNGNTLFLAAYTGSLRRTLETQYTRATHDPLTGLLNRRGLETLTTTLLTRTRPDAITVMTIDVDDFKLINDRCGHAVGDEVLREVGTRISDAASDGWGVARLGGDEFAVVAPLRADSARAECERLVGDLAFTVADMPVRVSLGAAVVPVCVPCPTDGVAGFLTDAMATADAALYDAKRSARGSAVIVHR